MDIVNLVTRDVIVEAKDGNWDEPSNFYFCSDELYALLGSPNGAAQAWILINHKEALGTNLKTVSQILVWTNGDDNLCYIPDLDVLDSRR